MEQSQSVHKPALDQLAKAYTAAWGEIDNVVKNSANPHFGSNYADLGAVLDTVRPVFKSHGLALLTAPGPMDGDRLSLTWVLMHASGQSIQGQMQIPVGKATAQAVGSAITYARRYMTAAITGIAQVDDDGNAASEAPREKKAKAPTADTGNILDQIAAAPDLPSLEKLKQTVAELGDQAVANAYVARKKELKGAK